MPVGSCLGGQIDNNEEANNGMEVIMTSSLLNQADQFAFMQQTLLMQVRTKTSVIYGFFARTRAKNAKRLLANILEKCKKIAP